MKTVPAGKSKRTGKSYEAFDICEQCNPWKGEKKTPKASNTDEVMNALRKLYVLVDELKEQFKQFTEAFTKKDE